MIKLILLVGMFDFPTDSLGMQMINGKKFVIYQVEGRESLFSISKRYGTTPEEIIAYNSNSDAGLEVGEILKVPYNPKPKSNAPRVTARGLVHKVSAHETLFGISRMYHITVDDIMRWNNMNTKTIKVGQELIVEKSSKVKKKPLKIIKNKSYGSKTHVVRPKETVYSISRKYGLGMQHLIELNGIKGNNLKIGQVLVVEQVSKPKKSIVVPPTKQQSGDDKINDDWKTHQIREDVKISESVVGSDEKRESGLAGKIEGSEGSRKYLAYHSKLKSGTIIKIRNLSNNLEVFARVSGPPPKEDIVTFVQLSQSVFDKLGVNEKVFKAEIIYFQ